MINEEITRTIDTILMIGRAFDVRAMIVYTGDSRYSVEVLVMMYMV